MNRRLVTSLLCVSALGGQLLNAQTPAAATPADNSNVQASANTDALSQLRARIAEQQEQIKKLQQAVDQQQKMLERSLANSDASAKSAATSDGTPVVATANNNAEPVKLVPAVDKTDIVNKPRYLQTGDVRPSPLSIPIGDTTFTPLGFIDATFFARSTSVGSGIGTNFAGIPYNSAAAGKLSKRTSRLRTRAWV